MTGTILVADDSPTMQRRASDLLIAEGLEVVTVSNGVAAIKKLPTVRPRLILADVSMPGMDGYEVCDFVKHSAEMSHVLVLLIYSELEPYQEGRGKEVRADGCVKKPFSHDELIATVTECLTQSELVRPAASHPVPVPIGFESMPSAELTEKAPEPETLSELDLAALSEGVALTEPLGECVPVSEELDAGEGKSATSVPAEGENSKDSEHRLSETPPTFGASPGMASRAEDDKAVQFSGLESEERRSGTLSLPVTGGPDQQQARLPSVATLEQPDMNKLELASEPAPAVAAPVTERGKTSKPETSELECEIASHAVVSGSESFSSGLECHLGVVGPPSVPLSENEHSDDISDLPEPPELQASSGFQTGWVESELEGEKESSLTVEDVEPQVATVKKLESEMICAIVRKVVLKMSPPALGPEVVEDIVRRIAAELTAEFDSHSS